jgi:Ni,Fe-hydrogenase I cytochrome b subunit
MLPVLFSDTKPAQLLLSLFYTRVTFERKPHQDIYNHTPLTTTMITLTALVAFVLVNGFILLDKRTEKNLSNPSDQ